MKAIFYIFLQKILNITFIKKVKLILALKKCKKIDIKEESMMARSSNRVVVPEAKMALNQMKLEIAGELGLADYDNIDKGNLTSRQNGYVGGYMTKRLVEAAERAMAGK